jgi:hypothetical protein
MLKRSIVASAALHFGIVAAVVFWPHGAIPPDESLDVVPVDLVTVADVTNVAATVEEKKPDAAPPEEPPAPESAPVPPPEAEAEPAPSEPDQRLTPPKQAEETTPPENPVLPRQKPKPDAPQKFDVDSVLAMLNKRTPSAPAPANAKVADTTQKGLGDRTAFTADLKDTLLSQMRQCWNVPVGAPNPEQLIVQVRVFLSADGSLAQPPQLEPGTRAAAASNPYMRTAAEAALRAINVCEPYKHLPPEHYDAWREIVMTFDPSKMIGR